MSDEKKSREASPQKPAAESKVSESKAADAKAETSATPETKPDAAPKRQGMGEGQKPVSKAYRDNWNEIFGKKKKR